MNEASEKLDKLAARLTIVLSLLSVLIMHRDSGWQPGALRRSSC
jgi:hypothetical protein